MRSNVQKSCDCKEGRIKKREVSVLDEEKPLPTRNDTGQRSVHNSFITVTSAICYSFNCCWCVHQHIKNQLLPKKEINLKMFLR